MINFKKLNTYFLNQIVKNSYKKLHNVASNINSKKIKKVLIANRGEIAVRIIKSAKKMGIKCVAVYSDIDENAMHVKLADDAYNIGLPPATSSYLDMEKIIEVAIKSKSNAIHPGYGFLSENFKFAKLCNENNLIFIGPSENAIKDMGIKSKSKIIMNKANVPIIPGYHGENQDAEFLFLQAKKIGFPIVIKAIQGGGGKGMRICLHEEDFFNELNSAKNEALKSFNNDEILIEKCIQKPRHIEVQIFGDMFGNYVYLFERDCSVQRRHQKIIEEAPASGLTEELRKQLGKAAVNAAKAVNYVGAGTVEFIFDCFTNQFYFMEMNTRLQVEHPITEMITNTDLVEMQFLVANGEKLPIKQDDLKIKGHSFEARIYAEDPKNGFLPSSGKITNLIEPKINKHVRVETGIQKGDEVSIYYDPMIAKLVVWSNTREKALKILKSNLSNYMITGFKTNIPFLIKLICHDEFKKGNVHTNFIQDYGDELFKNHILDEILICKFVMGIICNELKETYNKFTSPYDLNNSFRLFNLGFSKRNFVLINEELNKEINIEVTEKQEKLFDVKVNNKLFKNVGVKIDENFEITITLDKMKSKYYFFVDRDNLSLFSLDEQPFILKLKQPSYLYLKSENLNTSNHIVSLMPGILEKIFVKENEEVKKNQPLVIIIAMKMEYLIKSNRNCKVKKINFKQGDSVPKGALIINFEN